MLTKERPQTELRRQRPYVRECREVEEVRAEDSEDEAADDLHVPYRPAGQAEKEVPNAPSGASRLRT